MSGAGEKEREEIEGDTERGRKQTENEGEADNGGRDRQ
jgi:hypothetical protein